MPFAHLIKDVFCSTELGLQFIFFKKLKMFKVTMATWSI